MPSKNHGDRIWELERAVWTLRERVRSLQRTITRVESDTKDRFHRLETQTKDRSNRRWALLIAIIGLIAAIIGGIADDLFPKMIASFREQ